MNNHCERRGKLLRLTMTFFENSYPYVNVFIPSVFLVCLGVLPGYNPGSGIGLHSYKSALVIIRYAHCSDAARAKTSLACFACAHLWHECIDKQCIPKIPCYFLVL